MRRAISVPCSSVPAQTVPARPYGGEDGVHPRDRLSRRLARRERRGARDRPCAARQGGGPVRGDGRSGLPRTRPLRLEPRPAAGRGGRGQRPGRRLPGAGRPVRQRSDGGGEPLRSARHRGAGGVLPAARHDAGPRRAGRPGDAHGHALGRRAVDRDLGPAPRRRSRRGRRPRRPGTERGRPHRQHLPAAGDPGAQPRRPPRLGRLQRGVPHRPDHRRRRHARRRGLGRPRPAASPPPAGYRKGPPPGPPRPLGGGRGGRRHRRLVPARHAAGTCSCSRPWR